MKQYRVDIKPTAESDLETRYQQIAGESPQDAVENLAERCPIAPEDLDIQRGIRHLVIGNYRVLYITNKDVVEVLHVRHGRHDRKL